MNFLGSCTRLYHLLSEIGRYNNILTFISIIIDLLDNSLTNLETGYELDSLVQDRVMGNADEETSSNR